MKHSAITSFIAAMVLAAVALVTMAQELPADRPDYWPRLKGGAALTEWFSDVPWHQKLGTYVGNEIQVPLILPYELLQPNSPERAFCDGRKLTPEACMIETEVVNIMGVHRIETLYDPTDDKIANAAECKAPYQCTEVRLEVSSLRAQVAGSDVTIVPTKFGKRYDLGPTGDDYGGFQITDGSTYAPQMLWEMAHYCDSLWAADVDMQDPVCYADYFSPMNNGYNVIPGTAFQQWPLSQPWSVFPLAPAPPAGLNQCPPNDTKCVFAMAGFLMGQVPKDSPNLQYNKYNNDFLLKWFNNALTNFPKDLSPAEIQHHFPWSGTTITWEGFIYPRAVLNPFLGSYATRNTYAADPNPDCDTTFTGPSGPKCTKSPTYQAASYAYPRQCTLDNLAKAAAGSSGDSDNLRQCGLNYEIHPNGWLDQWPTAPINYRNIVRGAPFNFGANQYGRTSFLFAGVPGMQMPVSFYRDPTSDSGMSIYEQVHNASIFSLYLPVANIADVKEAMGGRNYTDTGFYHTLLMSNHMESDPAEFAEGIRGKVLWHNEYRVLPMYAARKTYSWLADRNFAAAFDPLKSKYNLNREPGPFHNNTCDGCHVRNGSGVPINPAGKLDPALQTFMSGNVYVPYADALESKKDYTFTGVIRPMKLVFFDLLPGLARLNSSNYSDPLSASKQSIAHAPLAVSSNDLYYNNKIMNFYGDSFHVSPPGAAEVFNYDWHYEAADASRIVVNNVERHNAELNKTYQPLQIKLGTFKTPENNKCKLVEPAPTTKPWPKTCADIDNTAIHAAFNGGMVGYILLNGKRLGNLAAIEAIPDEAITGFRDAQVASLGNAAGQIAWAPGSRDGVQGKVKKDCRTNTALDCYIGRFGWLGDRASLEDQVANAAFIEMNMTTKEGYKALYKDTTVVNPIRYEYPNCGAANKACVGPNGNSDLTEQDINRMADYGRWLGNPTRSEIQVSQPEVIAGETIFKKLQCDTCHVIKRIDIVPDHTMLSQSFRDRLGTHIGGANKPFLSYIGTDLLMHDMGYLSQIGDTSQSIRDADGSVKPGFETYVQKVRTPPLKGLRFNNYVTDAHRNTQHPGADPGCDFLLHDGRACDAIEAAFLHDGPAIKKLQVIEGLKMLSAEGILQLRAFLYSL